MTGFGLPVDIVKCKISCSLTFGLGTFFEQVIFAIYKSRQGAELGTTKEQSQRVVRADFEFGYSGSQNPAL